MSTSNIYICNLCQKQFQRFSDLKRHKNRKYPCSNNDTSKNTAHQCQYCDKNLSSKSVLNRHSKTCYLNPKPHELFQCEFCDNQYQTKGNLTRHLKTCKLKKKSVEIITPSVQNINNIHNGDINNNIIDNSINNTNVQIQNIVVVNKFGEENFDYITNEQYLKCLEVPYISIPRLITLLHYHPNHPENHNIRMTMTNKKYGLVNVFNGTSWIMTDKQKALNRLMDKGYMCLDFHFEDKQNKMKHTYAKRFKNYNYAFENSNDETGMKKKICKDIEIAMLNNTKTLQLTNK